MKSVAKGKRCAKNLFRLYNPHDKRIFIAKIKNPVRRIPNTSLKFPKKLIPLKPSKLTTKTLPVPPK